MPMNAPSFAARLQRRLHRWFPAPRRLSDPTPTRIDSAELNGLTAQIHRHYPADCAFHAAWDHLHQTSLVRTTFNSPLWQRDGLMATSLRLITLWRDSSLLAVFPLHLNSQGFLESPGPSISDYLDPLLLTPDAPQICSTLLHVLNTTWDAGVRAVTFRNLRSDSPFLTLLQSQAPAFGFSCMQTLASHAWRIALPSTWDAYLQSLDPHQRKELRRKLTKAQSHANAHLSTYDSRNSDSCPLFEMLDLIERSDPFKHDWFACNVRPLLTRIGPDLLRTGLLRLHVLYLNDCPAACLIEFPSPKGPMLYNTGFHPTFRSWSPGTVTFALAIQQSIHSAASTFDLLRGSDPYKQHLGATPHPLYH
ncbi:MAG: GNAT family N-acetyltransferase, partial [Bacillota bacterium]